MDRKKVIMLMVVVAVVGMCIYFMMSRESALGGANLQAGHAVAGATGETSGTIYPGFAPLTVSGMSSVKKVDPNRTIISFSQDGEIDDRLTLGDIMQNAYYLAEQGRLDMEEKSNAAHLARNLLEIKINNLADAIKSINYGLMGSTLGDPAAGYSPANHALIRKTSALTRADTDYKIVISGQQRSVGEDLGTRWTWTDLGRDGGMQGLSTPLNTGKKPNGYGSGAAFKFHLAEKDAEGKVI
jgi:hypothetical protein